MSTLTWLDFSDVERKRALQVVELLGRKDTRDELGLGAVRDAFANALFPGMSTVQRRAAYFLIVPWTFRMIERRPPRSGAAIEHVRWHELRTIDALLADGDRDGVIGGRVGQGLRQLPSMIYWSGLGRLGIRHSDGTREQWSRAVERGLVVTHDDDGQVVLGDSRTSWWDAGLPEPPEGFPQEVSLHLRPQDGEYVRARIIDRCPGTVLAVLAQRERPWEPTAFPWELDLPELTSKQADLLRHARRFSERMNGAALLYNHALAVAFEDALLTDTYAGALEMWAAREAALPLMELEETWAMLERLGSRHTPRTSRFVERWNELARDAGSVLSDRRFTDCVRERELEVKHKQARLSFPAARETWRGAAGVDQLEYRWSSTQRQLLDIVRAGRN